MDRQRDDGCWRYLRDGGAGKGQKDVMMRGALYLIPVLMLILLGAVLIGGLKKGSGGENLPSALIGKPIPTFSLPGWDNQPEVTQATFKGKVHLVNFFASWCLPCRAEHPLLTRLAQQTETPILGILYKDKTDAAAAYLQELGNPYSAIARDDTGRAGIEFGLYGVPETYLVDAEGTIRYRIAGPIAPETLAQDILPLLDRLKAHQP